MLSRIVDRASRALSGGASVEAAIRDAFRSADGTPDPVLCAQLMGCGASCAETFIRAVLDRLGPEHPELARRSPSVRSALAPKVVAAILAWPAALTGAEVVAAILAARGVREVYAYPGTSELAMCDAVEQTAAIRLINGRGDRECAFMAAGASLLTANRGAAILHGARGLTNAAGAVADARRNEVGVVYLVGLPSTGSVRYLPPHAEPDLIATMRAFSGYTWEAPAVPSDAEERQTAAARLVTRLHEAISAATGPPRRPSLFGLPEDVAEQRWVDLHTLAQCGREALTPLIDPAAVAAAAVALSAATRPLVLVDDYALRYAGMRGALDRLARQIGAPVLQLRYRRGPMLFERIQPCEVENFVGWLNQYSPEHDALLAECDLLVTVEDRNLYRRVVGDLPGCHKIAINSDPAKVWKNEYLGPDDLLVVGDPSATVSAIVDRMTRVSSGRTAWFAASTRTGAAHTPEQPSGAVAYGRRSLTRAIARVLSRWDQPVLVDDSQMFGGLLAENYDEFPPRLRVFGGHGGFVGAGLAYAVGLATSHAEIRVMCTLGDQAFTNSFQGLVAAVQERSPVLFVVCNNGESVSLNKQATATFGGAARRYLANSSLQYRALAASMGVPATRVSVPVGDDPARVDEAVAEFSRLLDEAATVDGPALVELVLPSDAAVWRGIWLTQGFERQSPRPAERMLIA
jgi:acetolactate synthase I/II/III large subunit